MNRILVGIAMLLQGYFLAGQTDTPCLITPAVEVLHGNYMRVRMTFDGNADMTTGATSFAAEYDGSPSPLLNLFTGGIWLGAQDPDGNLRLAASSKFTSWKHYMPGPLGSNGEIVQENCDRWNKIWRVSRTEIEQHRADYADNGQIDQPLASVIGWPGRGNPYFEIANGFPLPDDTTSFAPFYDRSGDGFYDPFDGDYPHPDGLTPDVSVADMLWMLFNSGGSNLDCDIQSTVWALNCTGNDLLNNTYFQSFKVTNRDTVVLDSFILGIWQLGRVGCPFPLWYMGTRADLQTVFVYKINPDSDSTCSILPGFMEGPPVGALTILNRPLYKSIYMTNTSIGIVPYAVSQPNLPSGYYNFLNGRWNDGSPLTYGWTGYTPQNPFGIPVDHYFTGDPNDPSSWSAQDAGVSWLQNASTLASAKIGTLLPGQSREVDLAFSYHSGEGLTGLQNVGYMFDRVAELRQSYDEQFEDVCEYSLCQADDDCVWPGDTNRDGIVNQCDILPFGSGWAATGPSREGFVNWAPQTAANWGQTPGLGYDLKHLDANGNGEVEQYDAQVIRDFYGNVTPWWVQGADEYPVGDDFYIKLLPDNFDTTNVQAGQVCFVAVRFDSLKTVRGATFELELDSAYWEIVTSGFVQGQGVILVHKSVPTGLAGGRVRVDSQQAFSDGGWATMKIKAKSIPPTQSNTTYIRLKNIKGIAPDGSEVALGAYPQKFVFAGGSSAADAPAGTEAWRVSPNPAADVLRIETPGERLQEVVFYDLAGRVLRREMLNGNSEATVNVGQLPRGMVLVEIRTAERTGVRKVALGD